MRMRQRLAEAIGQQIAVGQTGELIVRRQVLEVELGPLELVDLPGDPQQPDDGA